MPFLDPRVWVAILLALLLGYGIGFGHHAWKTSKRDAAVEAVQTTTQEVTTSTITTVDTAGVDKLKAQLSATQRRAATLQAQLNEAKNANPPSADCRLPVGLRDSINHHLDASGAP